MKVLENYNRSARGRLFYRLVPYFFGDYTVARNQHDAKTLVYVFVYGTLLTFGLLAFHYCPLRWFGVELFIACTGICLIRLVRTARKNRWFALLVLLLSALAIIDRLSLGLTLFGFVLDAWFFKAFFTVGVLSFVYRLWNGIVWSLIDRAGAVGGLLR